MTYDVHQLKVSSFYTHSSLDQTPAFLHEHTIHKRLITLTTHNTKDILVVPRAIRSSGSLINAWHVRAVLTPVCTAALRDFNFFKVVCLHIYIYVYEVNGCVNFGVFFLLLNVSILINMRVGHVIVTSHN